MVPLIPEQHTKAYGKLIVDFANARNTDEACAELIRGTQQKFDFSEDFLKQFEKELPSLSKFKSTISKPEMDLLKLVMEECYLKGFLNIQLEENMQPEEWFYQKYIDDKRLMKKRLMEVEKLKTRFRKKISKERYSELKGLANIYELVTSTHNHIFNLQIKLRTILNDIVKGKNLYNNQVFKDFLSYYSFYYQPNLILHPDGSFKYEYDSAFSKENFFYHTVTASYNNTSETYTGYYRLIIYSLIEFVKSERNRQLIYKCEQCRNFYIADKVDSRNKFCTSCSSKSKMSKEKRAEYQKKYRQRKKKKKLAIEREARIENLISKGWTREEVKEIIEADSMM